MKLQTSIEVQLDKDDSILLSLHPDKARPERISIHGAAWRDWSGTWSLDLKEPTIKQAEALERAAAAIRSIVARREAKTDGKEAPLAAGDHEAVSPALREELRALVLEELEDLDARRKPFDTQGRR